MVLPIFVLFTAGILGHNWGPSDHEHQHSRRGPGAPALTRETAQKDVAAASLFFPATLPDAAVRHILVRQRPGEHPAIVRALDDDVFAVFGPNRNAVGLYYNGTLRDEGAELRRLEELRRKYEGIYQRYLESL